MYGPTVWLPKNGHVQDKDQLFFRPSIGSHNVGYHIFTKSHRLVSWGQTAKWGALMFVISVHFGWFPVGLLTKLLYILKKILGWQFFFVVLPWHPLRPQPNPVRMQEFNFNQGIQQEGSIQADMFHTTNLQEGWRVSFFGWKFLAGCVSSK